MYLVSQGDHGAETQNHGQTVKIPADELLL
jgi:hypothetical protein